MLPVKITHLDDHSIITGSDHASVELAIATLVAKGFHLLESIRPLGKNWIATVQRAHNESTDWCEVTRIGLQHVIEGATQAVVLARIESLSSHGAVLIAGPEQVEGRWVAVVDEKGVVGRRA